MGSFDLGELRAAARASVENDPDDLWNQFASHDQMLRAIDAAPTHRGIRTVPGGKGFVRRAAILARVSTGAQAAEDRHSLPMQVEMLT